jgi:hypothetical protein
VRSPARAKEIPKREQTAIVFIACLQLPKKSTGMREFDNDARICSLTMRLSDAGLQQRQTKALYSNHRLPPWFTEDATRDRSNRLLGQSTNRRNDNRPLRRLCCCNHRVSSVIACSLESSQSNQRLLAIRSRRKKPAPPHLCGSQLCIW